MKHPEAAEDRIEKPPYTITPDMLAGVERIGEAIGRAEAAAVTQDFRLRRINRIRTIHGSLAIEGNTLSEEQISTILDGKPVAAPLRDVQEVRNAIKAYDRYHRWDPANESDLLDAHYEAIRQSSAKGESTPFVSFMLEILLDALRTDQASDQVSDQVARLLAELRTGPKTAVELMAAMGLSHRPTFRNNYLRPAMSAGLVEMTHPESPTAKNQRYRLTRRGREGRWTAV